MEIPFRDPVLIFASVMVLILVAPLLARKLRLPGIVGLILAGLVFGPHGLGLIDRDATIRLLGEVGLLMIMFLAGLEIDLHQVRRNRTHSLVFGLITFLIPLAVGSGVAMWMMAVGAPTAILLSSMYSSHTLLTFPAVTKLGLTRSRAVTTTIGGTIITDTLALLVLAVIASSVQGDASVEFWLRLAGSMVVYVVAVLLVLPRLGRWFLREVAADETVAFVFVLAVTFIAAYLAHVAGLEPIIGAFLAGLTLNSLIPEKSGLMARLHFTGNALFIPFFLLSVGMLVNLELLVAGAEAWIVIGVMTTTALITKWLAAVVSGRLLRYTPVESRLIYGLSVNQAAATLAAALVGYDIGLFNDAIITGTIVMIGVTCFVGPVVTERAGKRLVEGRSGDLREGDTPPSRVLISVMDKKHAIQLLEIAMYLRGSAGGHEPVYPIHVVPDGPDAEQHVARGEELLAHMVVRALASNVPVNPLTTVDVNVSSGILRAVRENRISTLVMGWDGEHRRRMAVFGRILDRVVAGTERQILVNRLVRPVATARRILLVLPPLAEREVGFAEAVHSIKQLASQCGTSVTVYADTAFPEDAWNFFRKTSPEVKADIQRYSHWKGLIHDFGRELKREDWLVLFSARKGSIAWQPKSDRLPAEFAGSYPDTNVSILYAAGERYVERVSGDDSRDSPTAHAVERVFSPELTLLDTRYVQMDSLVRDVVRLLPGVRPSGVQGSNMRSPMNPERLVSHLTAIARNEPVELMPDVVLLHAHAPEVDRSTTLLAVTREDLALSEVEGPVHVVVVLLDPIGQDPGEHLKALGRVAGAMRTPGLTEKMRGARTFDDLL